MALRAARLARWTCAFVLAVAAAAAPASAERAVGVTADNTLLLFDTATPGTVTPRAITGLQTVDEVPLGVDIRPATGELFLITAKSAAVGAASVTRTYKLD